MALLAFFKQVGFGKTFPAAVGHRFERLEVFVGVDFQKRLVDVVSRNLPCLELIDNAHLSPVFDAVFAARKAFGKPFFAEKILADEVDDNFIRFLCIHAQTFELFSHFHVATLLVGAKMLEFFSGFQWRGDWF